MVKLMLMAKQRRGNQKPTFVSTTTTTTTTIAKRATVTLVATPRAATGHVARGHVGVSMVRRIGTGGGGCRSCGQR